MTLPVPPLERIRLSAVSHRARQTLTDDKIIGDFQIYLTTLLSDKPRPRAARPRLAPFQPARLSVAVSGSTAGLAVFDAIRSLRVHPASPRSLSLAPAIGNWQTIADLEIRSAAGRRCPSCGWKDVRRSTAHNFNDYLLSVFGLVPYRCRTCSDRFHRSRQTAPSPGLSNPEVSSMPSRTLNMPGNLSSHGLFAAGTYSRALASIAATPGMRAARPAD